MEGRILHGTVGCLNRKEFGHARALAKADALADYLSNHKNFLSHGRRVKIADLQPYHVRIFDTRTNQALRQAVWDLWCAIDITLRNSPTAKIYENGQGHAVVVRAQWVANRIDRLRRRNLLPWSH